MMVCERCSCPTTATACDNPGCVANPAVPEAVKARWQAERERAEAERLEQERFAAIRNSCYSRH